MAELSGNKQEFPYLATLNLGFGHCHWLTRAKHSLLHSSVGFFFFKYFWLGHGCCACVFLVMDRRVYTLVLLRGLLIAVASLVAKLRL